MKSMADKQLLIKEIINRKEFSKLNQLLTQINGVKKVKSQIQKALEAPLGEEFVDLKGLAHK